MLNDTEKTTIHTLYSKYENLEVVYNELIKEFDNVKKRIDDYENAIAALRKQENALIEDIAKKYNLTDREISNLLFKEIAHKNNNDE